MAYLYDVSFGVLVESDVPLHVDEIDDARARLDGGEPLESVAARLGGRVPDLPDPLPRVVVAAAEVDALHQLEQAARDQTDLAAPLAAVDAARAKEASRG